MEERPLIVHQVVAARSEAAAGHSAAEVARLVAAEVALASRLKAPQST